LALLVSLSVLTVTGCSDDGVAAAKVLVTGSTTIMPIAEVAAEMYAEDRPDVAVLVSGMGSSAGIESVSNGSSDIGTSSRELKDEERALGLVDTPVAYDAIAVIVNHDNPVKSLTTMQVRQVFAGVITNWSELGGPDLEIGLVNRDEASGTREAFKKIVMGDAEFDRGAVILPGTGQVRAVVSDVPGAIGYISLGFVNEDVHAVVIDGVEPSEATVVSGDYPVQRVLHFFTRGEPSAEAAGYIDYVLSPAVQDSIVRDAGFIPITAKEALGD
jgi:phosphate transport system substrate-binding protein